MKVSKLINILQTFNQEADITTSIAEDITISYIVGDNEYTRQTTPQLFVEPFDCICCTQYDECNIHNINECETPIMEWIQ